MIYYYFIATYITYLYYPTSQSHLMPLYAITSCLTSMYLCYTELLLHGFFMSHKRMARSLECLLRNDSVRGAVETLLLTYCHITLRCTPIYLPSILNVVLITASPPPPRPHALNSFSHHALPRRSKRTSIL